jgi:hypothetical protein
MNLCPLASAEAKSCEAETQQSKGGRFRDYAVGDVEFCADEVLTLKHLAGRGERGSAYGQTT